MLGAIDQGRLTPRYWTMFGMVFVQLALELFDYVIIGYIVAAMAPVWHLSFGQVTAILTSAGVGAIFGSLGFGWLSDRIGRKSALMASTALYAIAAGSTAFLAEGDWKGFVALRFLVGLGYAGAITTQFTLIAEYTPTRYRTLLTSSMAIPVSLGVLLASITFSASFELLGWRGIAALGYVPLLLMGVFWFVVPESARWQLTRGRTAQARASLRRMTGADPGEVSAPPMASTPHESAGVGSLFKDQRRFWLILIPNIVLASTMSAMLLWGPTILRFALGITPAEAALAFMAITVSGLIGRIVFSYLPHRIGRVRAGQIIGFGASVCLLAAALLMRSYVGPVSLLLVMLALGQLFYDGGFANILSYGAELYPTRFASLAIGLGQAGSGTGKMIGPIIMGAFVGVHAQVDAASMEAALRPSLILLAACCFGCGLAFTFLGIETNRRDLTL